MEVYRKRGTHYIEIEIEIISQLLPLTDYYYAVPNLPLHLHLYLYFMIIVINDCFGNTSAPFVMLIKHF